MQRLTGTVEQFAQLAELLLVAFGEGSWSTDQKQEFDILIDMDEEDTIIYELLDGDSKIGGEALSFNCMTEDDEIEE